MSLFANPLGRGYRPSWAASTPGSSLALSVAGSYRLTLSAALALTFTHTSGTVFVSLTQDATGGRAVTIGTTVDWSAAGSTPTIPTTASTTSFLAVTRVGSSYTGLYVLGAAPFYVPIPTTVNSQTFQLTGNVMRGTRTFVRDSYYAFYTTYCSSGNRARMAANGVNVQIAERFPTDTLTGAYLRGQNFSGASSWENAGAFFGQGNAVNLRGYATNATPGSQAELDLINDTAGHEYAHSEDALFFGGANSADPYSVSSITSHPPMITLHGDCVAAGISPNNRQEWFASCRGYQRQEAFGSGGTVTRATAAALALMGTGSGVLASGTPQPPGDTLNTRDRGTQAQRWTRFKDHMVTTISATM